MIRTATIRSHGRNASAPLAACVLLTVLCNVEAQDVSADSQARVHRRPASSDSLVIQGRIIAMQGALVTVKTPDGYPGGPGIHAQFVVAGPTFKVDVSRARVLLPDGRRPDTRPLAVGDPVLMLLSGPDSGPPAPGTPGNVNQTYFASVIERIACNDKIITH